ncbi:acetoin utilization protein AcuC [Miltoncostaea marina]|uniref:acetoin utilization protein AcuC n=1 Tax=Miltoncostaea marina TaxID=2843215 RepID=UPI001C3DEDB5|nr:acetoin utilization protein AcuC [Miltoncostaea marina]
MDAPPARLLVVHDDALGMRFGGDHPTDPRRHRLAVALCREAGILAAEGVAFDGAPGPMPDEELARTFAPAFIRAVRRYSARPVLAAEPEARQWGIGGDLTPYAGMHEDSARACAACAAAADAVGRGRARAALVPAGGAHHGLANRAWGFGIYNETAVAIRALRDAGARRVAYVDLDVHHGNGTQWMFYDDPDVLTVSVHESGRHLFPGSGFAAETGGAAARGSSANVALPPFAGDDAYRRAMEAVVVPVVRAFGPDAIVAQCGVDHHHADPLSHMLTTMPLYPELWRALRELADATCGGRIVALGGGGYDPCTAPPRAWALLAAELAGAPVAGPVPASWRALAAAAGCPEPAARWLEDRGPAPDPGRDRRAAAEAEAAIALSVAALSRFWPLASA